MFQSKTCNQLELKRPGLPCPRLCGNTCAALGKAPTLSEWPRENPGSRKTALKTPTKQCLRVCHCWGEPQNSPEVFAMWWLKKAIWELYPHTRCYASNKVSGCVLPPQNPSALLKSPGTRAAEVEGDAHGAQPFLFPLFGTSLQNDNVDLFEGDSVEADLDACDRAGNVSL